MNNNSGKTESLWMQVELPPYEMLKQDLEVDVCIVGAGIAGLSSAYTLAKKGLSVAVLDKGAVGGGQSARTTAHLTWALDDRFYELERLFGEEGTKYALESHAKAIDYIEHIVKEEQIECDFERVDGYLFVPPKGSSKILDKELLAIQKINQSVVKVDRAPFKDFDTGPCLKFPNQGQFHILKYLKGLIQAIENYGSKVYANTQVIDIEDKDPCLVKTKSAHRIKAKQVIVATCSPINDRLQIHSKQAAYRTYVIAAKMPPHSVAQGLYWDTPDPYHYVRMQKNWIIIGGEDHKTGQAKDFKNRYDRLEKWARERFPDMGEVEYRWSGQVFEPVDALGFIGKNPHSNNIYIATGDSGNGMTHGTIAGILIPELIQKKTHHWEELYSPSRKPWKALKEYASENLNTFIQYKDWLTPGELSEVNALAPEEGKILRKGLKKLAVFKDKEGQIHINSAFCPHLGACLRFNNLEKSWDCPAHGSRFDGCGHQLNAPARGDL